MIITTTILFYVQSSIMNQKDNNKQLILKYWNSWQAADWTTLRSSLADQLDFAGNIMDSDDFVGMCQQGSPWRDVVMLSSFFTEEGGALLYEGVDTSNGQTIRVGEFIQVRGGQIIKSIASFGSGMPPQ